LDQYRSFDGSAEDFIDYNRAFHIALAQASGNRRMASAARDLIEQADRLVRISIANVKGRDHMQLVGEHVSLIDAMQRRDQRGAARIIKAHIEKTEKRVLPALARNAIIVEGRDL
jgi:DNA-binding GntR family transcriptional regulator